MGTADTMKILRSENAALRQQVEELQVTLGKLKTEVETAKINSGHWEGLYDASQARAQAAEAALELEKEMNLDNVQNAELERQESQATIAALREGLKDLDYELNLYVATGGDWKELRKLIHKLLSSPNPGAKVEAVVEAAKEWAELFPFQNDESVCQNTEITLLEAVRALKEKAE